MKGRTAEITRKTQREIIYAVGSHLKWQQYVQLSQATLRSQEHMLVSHMVAGIHAFRLSFAAFLGTGARSELKQAFRYGM